MMTKIQWTEATWNPIVGCSLVSPGCTNCYAMRAALRLSRNAKTPHYAGTVKTVNGKPVWTGKMAKAPDRTLTAPLRQAKPTTYFVNSMGDLFHETVPWSWIDQVFAIMALCPQHTFQVLTKRAATMRDYLTQDDGFGRWGFIEHEARKIAEIPEKLTLAVYGGQNLPNVWLGVSAEDQRRWNERREALRDTPAAVRFVSAEPLLAPIDFGADLDWLDWVIVGGESGPGARQMELQWARDIVAQCKASAVPVFVKQLGAKPTHGGAPIDVFRNPKAGDPSEWPADLRVRELPR